MNNALSFGQKGTRINTGTVTGQWFVLQALDEAVVEINVNWSDNDADGPLIAESVSLVAGQALYGTITSITIISGTVVAYTDR